MAPTPSSKSAQNQATPSKTPQSKHRLHFNNVKNTHPSPNPNSLAAEHPVEVISRIRDYPDRKDKPISALQISADRQSVRVRTDIGYRDFSLDGVSASVDEDLDGFYKKFVESRISGVKLGAKCTVMMYGPTGSGKSHTMFGCPKQPGIVYRALRDILGEVNEENNTDGQSFGMGLFVQVTVLEIYNEEIYDLLSNNNGGGGGQSIGFHKGTASKVRLEVMGKKAQNATFISGNEAGKISREVAKVEKRRIVKSTFSNDRSSRSHCMIILDVPLVGGRLMLVDMAGSENIEQGGPIGLEAKMQTAKINQGNTALKRVVESIANGDSHVPFRDSKLTMLLQDSFEDDKSKILMILCVSPDPKEMYKTISTLEYGAKAKCIVRGFQTPTKDKIGTEDSSPAIVLGSRIAAMDQFIYKLQMENKLREKERNEAHKELMRKEQEIAALRNKLELMEEKGSGASEEEINLKVNERTRILKLELEKKLQECQLMAEKKILRQQEEFEMLRRRLEEIESALCQSKDNNSGGNGLQDTEGNSFAKKLLEIYADGDIGMEKSMDLDMGDQQLIVHDVKEIDSQTENIGTHRPLNSHGWTTIEDEDDDIVVAPKFTQKVCLSTVFEEEDEEGEGAENTLDEEVEKEIVEETTVHVPKRIDGYSPGINLNISSFVASPQQHVLTPNSYNRVLDKVDCSRDRSEEKHVSPGLVGELENSKDMASARRTRIQNIFLLCGNHRELSQQVRIPTPDKKRSEPAEIRSSPVMTLDDVSVVKSHSKESSQHLPVPALEFGNRIMSALTVRNVSEAPNLAFNMEPFAPLKLANSQNSIESLISRSPITSEITQESKENKRPGNENNDSLIEVYVKWEASKETPGNFITKLKVVKDSTLSDIRKLIETHLGEENSKQGFTFLMLGDPIGAPVAKEKEETVQANKLPICNNQLSGYLACLRPVKGAIQRSNHLPFSSLENKLPSSLNSPTSFMQKIEGFSPQVGQNMSVTPYVNSRRRKHPFATTS